MVKKKQSSRKLQGSCSEPDPITDFTEEDERPRGILTDYETTAEELGSSEEGEIPVIDRPQTANFRAEVHSGNTPVPPFVIEEAEPLTIRRPNPAARVGRRHLLNPHPTDPTTPTRHPSNDAGDYSPSIYGVVKGALGEMTSQIISAIQTAFEGLAGRRQPDHLAE